MFENIRKLRLEHNLTQKQLAEIIGTTQQCINNYEHRNTYPSFDILQSLAEYFDVSLDYLCLGVSPGSQSSRFVSGDSPEDYSKEELLQHRLMFDHLPSNQKRSIDHLVMLLNQLNRSPEKTKPDDPFEKNKPGHSSDSPA